MLNDDADDDYNFNNYDDDDKDNDNNCDRCCCKVYHNDDDDKDNDDDNNGDRCCCKVYLDIQSAPDEGPLVQENARVRSQLQNVADPAIDVPCV